MKEKSWLIKCKISHISGIIYLLKFESNNWFVSMLPTEGHATAYVSCLHWSCGKVSGKQLRREKTVFHCTIRITFFFTKHCGLMAGYQHREVICTWWLIHLWKILLLQLLTDSDRSPAPEIISHQSQSLWKAQPPKVPKSAGTKMSRPCQYFVIHLL